MMPGARFFFIARPGPLFVLLDLYATPQHVGFRLRYRTGAIGRFRPHRTFGYAGFWI
jgi:hypothetical protein